MTGTMRQLSLVGLGFNAASALFLHAMGVSAVVPIMSGAVLAIGYWVGGKVERRG